ncbi:MAG: hypothetical protein QXF06_05445 [Archaeoglobaceae archaeon]
MRKERKMKKRVGKIISNWSLRGGGGVYCCLCRRWLDESPKYKKMLRDPYFDFDELLLRHLEKKHHITKVIVKGDKEETEYFYYPKK